jgi:hypothetical protein
MVVFTFLAIADKVLYRITPAKQTITITRSNIITTLNSDVFFFSRITVGLIYPSTVLSN